MDDRGNLRQFSTPEEARAAGFNIPLSPDEAKELEALRMEDRMAALASKRHIERKSRLMAGTIALTIPEKPLKEKYPGQRTAYLVGANRP